MRGHLGDEVRRVARQRRHPVKGTGRLGRQLDLGQLAERAVDGGEVALDDLASLLAVRLLDPGLDPWNNLFHRQNAGELEETRLHDGVDPRPESELLGQPVRVDHVEPQVLVDELLLHLDGQLVPHLVVRIRRVQQDRPAGFGQLEHLHRSKERELVNADHVGLLDQVRRADLLVAEPKVRDGNAAGLLRVQYEVALDELVRAVSDDLDRVLARANGAVGAEAKEDRRDRLARHSEVRVRLERKVRDVVHDADREAALRTFARELSKDTRHHGWRELLARQPVAATDQGLHGAAPVEHRTVHQRSGHVEVKRFGRRSRFLETVEDGDVLGAFGKGREEGLHGERPVEPDGQVADLLTAGDEGVHSLLHRAGPRAHDHDDALGVRSAVVLDEVVLPPGVLGELVHRVLNDPGNGVMERVAGLPGLEEDIGVLRGTAQGRGVGGEPAHPVLQNEVVRQHCAHHVVADDPDLVDLVRGAEPVEEVHERNASVHGGDVGDQGEVLRLLHRRGAEHCPPRHPRAHDVRVIAEDRQGVGGQRARRDVDHARRQLAGDLVHVGQHQEQTLGRCEGRAKSAFLYGAVQRSGRSGLGLHLDDLGN